jgi:hypothetical protein
MNVTFDAVGSGFRYSPMDATSEETRDYTQYGLNPV